MRDEDVGCETLHDNPHHKCTQPSFNARCAESNDATNASDGVLFAVGTMVWTLFDYYGEPPVGGPEVSSTYGQYDLCGFPKAAAFWYRTQWLLNIPDQSDKTFYTHGSHEVRHTRLRIAVHFSLVGHHKEFGGKAGGGRRLQIILPTSQTGKPARMITSEPVRMSE
jgi:hypothetical protein